MKRVQEDSELTFLRYKKIGPTAPMGAFFSAKLGHQQREQILTIEMMETRLAVLKEDGMDSAMTERVIAGWPKDN